MRGRSFVLVLYCTWLGACITTSPPIEEYHLARAALEAARRIEAARVAGGAFHKAEEAFRRAEILYQNKEYTEAQTFFNITIQEAEKAENAAALLKWKNGEVF